MLCFFNTQPNGMVQPLPRVFDSVGRERGGFKPFPCVFDAFRHRHSSRVSLLARHNPAPTKRHSTEMPFRCLLFPAFSKQDETPFVGSSLARPHTLARCLSTPSEHNETPFRAQNPLHQLF